jgi:hypothetical protein
VERVYHVLTRIINFIVASERIFGTEHKNFSRSSEFIGSCLGCYRSVARVVARDAVAILSGCYQDLVRIAGWAVSLGLGADQVWSAWGLGGPRLVLRAVEQCD